MRLELQNAVPLVVMACLLSLTGCSRGQADSPAQAKLAGRLIVSGSSTIAPLAGEIAKQFESLHPGVRIDVQSGGSSRGIADARRGTADIGMASRALKPAESSLTAHTVARDGIALIVHRDNPVTKLTDGEVVGIYTDGINDWSQVGGNNAPITVVNKAEGRSTLELFLSHFKLAADAVRPSVVIGDNLQGILTVAGDPNAVGYVSIGAAQYEASAGRPIKLLPMDGIEATVANVRNGSFPLARPLNLVTHGPMSPLASAFIDYASSSAVNGVVEAQYFVPVSR